MFSATYIPQCRQHIDAGEIWSEAELFERTQQFRSLKLTGSEEPAARAPQRTRRWRDRVGSTPELLGPLLFSSSRHSAASVRILDCGVTNVSTKDVVFAIPAREESGASNRRQMDAEAR